MEREQQSLPFGEAEGSHAERLAAERAALAGALAALAAAGLLDDLHVVVLVRRVLAELQRSGRAEWSASYEELAAAPDGLCCSAATCRRVVQRALALRLITSATAYLAGAQRANRYALDWSGIADIRASRAAGRANTPPFAAAVSPPRQESETLGPHYPPVQIEHPPMQIEHPPVQIEHPNSDDDDEFINSKNSSSSPAQFATPQQIEQAPSATWRQAEEAIAICGVCEAERCCVSARQRGATPADVLALVDVYRRRPRQHPAELYQRVRNFVRGIAPQANWRQTAEERAAAERQSRREREQRRREEAALRAWLAEGRRRGVPEQELHRLAPQKFSKGAIDGVFCAEGATP